MNHGEWTAANLCAVKILIKKTVAWRVIHLCELHPLCCARSICWRCMRWSNGSLIALSELLRKVSHSCGQLPLLYNQTNRDSFFFSLGPNQGEWRILIHYNELICFESLTVKSEPSTKFHYACYSKSYSQHLFWSFPVIESTYQNKFPEQPWWI